MAEPATGADRRFAARPWGAVARRSLRRAHLRPLVAAVAALAALALASPDRRPLLVWNVTASSPVGFYLVSEPTAIRRGQTVIAWPPRAARELGAARRYLPRNVPLVKRVTATSGDRACAAGPALTVNGRIVARRRAADPSGRPMPWWRGCVRLRDGELLLLTEGLPGAFDGRYFGVTPPSHVVGRARLLWPR